MRGDSDLLFGNQDMEVVGIKDDMLFPGFDNRLPKLERIIAINLIQINKRCMTLGLVSDNLRLFVRLQINGYPKTIRN